MLWVWFQAFLPRYEIKYCPTENLQNLESVWPPNCKMDRFLDLKIEISRLSESHSVVSDSLRPHRLHSPWNSPGHNTGVGRLSLLQGIFPTQGSQPGLPHCRQILYSHIAGRFFTSWATKEAQEYWSGYPIPSPKDLPYPGIEPGSPALEAEALPSKSCSQFPSSSRTFELQWRKTRRAASSPSLPRQGPWPCRPIPLAWPPDDGWAEGS